MKKIQLLFCLLLIPIIVSAQDVWQAKYVEIEQSIKVPNFKNKQYRITKFEALASALAAVNQKAFDTDNGCMADLGCTQDNHDHDYPSAENVAIDCLLGNICSEGWNSIAFPSVTMVEYNSSKLGNPVEKVDNSKQHKWNCQFALEKDVELIGNYRNPVYVLNSWNPTQISMVDTLRIQGARGRLAATLEVPVLKVGEKCPIVIICHGFGVNRDRGTTYMVAKQLPNEGIATLRFDFNGHGQSDGKMKDMTVLNEVEDAKCVYQYAAGLPFVDRERIAMLGASQGGVVTSMAVGELGSTKIKAAVLMCPAAVLRDDCIKGLLMGKRYDPLDPPEVVQVGDKCIGREFIKTTFRLPIYETAAKFQGRACIIHGTGDRTAPYTYGIRYHKIWTDSEYHELDGYDHSFNPEPQTAVSIAIDFLKRTLLYAK